MDYGIENVLSLISKIHSQSADFLQKELESAGLDDFSCSHGNILFCLSRFQKIPMNELSERINRDKSTTTVLTRKLEKLGFVQVEKDSEDSRKKLISLTEKGRNFNDVTSSLSKKLIEQSYAGFSDEEKITLVNLLNRVAENLRNKQEKS